MELEVSRRRFSYHIYKSGLPTLWFDTVVYASIAAAFGVLADTSSPSAWPLGLVSYVLCVVFVVTKSRGVYGYLSTIYVDSQSNVLWSIVAYSILQTARLFLMTMPVVLFFWFRDIGNVPV